MKLREAMRLAHREVAAERTRSRATIVTVGLLFGVLLAGLMVMQGLENLVMKYADGTKDGKIYFLVSCGGDCDEGVVRDWIKRYGGIENSNEITRMWRDENAMEAVLVVEFDDLKEAYSYYENAGPDELHYRREDYEIQEILGNQVGVYGYFREKEAELVRPISIGMMTVAVVILALTLGHVMASEVKTGVIYRAVGASRRQLALIYLLYLGELCLKAIGFAVVLSIILVGVATAVGWNYLIGQITFRYPKATDIWPILWGMNRYCVAVVGGMILAVPVAFILCLDQFSDRKLVEKMKGE